MWRLISALHSMAKNQKLKIWAFGLLMAALLAACWLASARLPPPNEPKRDKSQVSSVAPRSSTAKTDKPSLGSTHSSGNRGTFDRPFRAWLTRYSSLPASSSERDKMLPAGVELAKARRPAMEKLIREEPRRAVDEALSFGEWAALPDEIKAEVERPFSVSADYTYYPICREPGTPTKPGEPTFLATLSMPDGSSLQMFSYGRREEVLSKRALPVQGISLGGLAAMRDGPMQIVDPAELATVRALFPDGQKDMSRSLVSGNKVEGEAVYALAGGRLYAFSSMEEAQALDSKLAQLDALPGPFASSSTLPTAAFYSSGDGSLNFTQVETLALEQSSSWTGSKKKLFLIRINFTDKPDEPVARSSAEAVMSNASDRIREISYGKTWVEGIASANVYTMPQTYAYYTSSLDRQTGELIRDARNTFRQQKSGEDASVNIGPVSALSNGSGGGLGDYNIVGIFRAPLPGEGGRASIGGADLYMMANDARIYTHEWGHNYGVHHASFWQTTDGSVVGAGSSDEYGDIFDIMGCGPVPEGHFHPQAKEKLNWLNSSQWVDASVAGAGIYRIYPFDDPATSGSIRGVRVTESATLGQEEYFWVGLRANAANGIHPKQSAYLIWQRAVQTRSWLIDTTPSSAAGRADSSLALGATFVTPVSKTYITPIGAGGSGSDSYIDVQIGRGPFASNSPPVIAGGSLGAATNARVIGSLAANATDPDGDALRYYWDFGADLPILEGKDAKFVLPFGGSYDVTLRVVDANGLVSTNTQTLTLQDPTLSFTKRESGGSTYAMLAIAANDAIAVAVGDAHHHILTSPDGVTWTKRSLPIWTYLQDIVWDGSKFLVTGHSWRTSGGVAQWHNVIHTSPDGITWAERYVGTAGVRLVRKLAAKPGGPAIAGGDQGFFMRSPDGLSWSELSIPALGTSAVKALAWSGQEFVMLTDNATVKLLTSTDGIQWIDRTSGIGLDATWKSLSRVSWLNDRLVASGWYSYIRTSTNGGQTFAASRLSDNVDLPAMAYGNGIYFGAGWDLGNSSQDVDVFSINGNDWYSYVAGTTNDRTGATFFKNTFITVDRGGEIRQSGVIAPLKDFLAIREMGPVSWDGTNSAVQHRFLGLPGQRRILQFSPDLKQPWLTHGEIEAGPLGVFDVDFRQSGDQRTKWNKGMFFRLMHP